MKIDRLGRVAVGAAGAIVALIAAASAEADTVSWNSLGNGATTSSPYVVMSAGGNTVTFANDTGFEAIAEGDSGVAYWKGNLDTGSLDLFNNYSQAPVTISFSDPLSSLSLEISAFDSGAYTGTLTAYDGDTLLGSISASGWEQFTPDTAPVLSFSGKDITRVVLTSTNDGHGFAIGPISMTVASAVPEPATWAMLILGVGLIGCAARRRRLGAVFAA